MGRDDDENKDWVAEYVKLRELPEFEDVLVKYRETVEAERPEDAGVFNSDYKVFCQGFEKVRKAHFSNVNPRTLERARSGDVDGAIDLLKEMGIVTKNGLSD